ncbi:MAG TPA: flagellar basal body rod C-terminal domain-containing protein [Devosia sp.]|nr:flagellar basal body rod C-terminal domain-containing protein [Devosia sp.]
MTISALSSGVSGLQRATQRLETSAARIANPATPGADMAEDLVNVLTAKLDFEASTKVIKTASAMQKSAIDILA